MRAMFLIVLLAGLSACTEEADSLSADHEGKSNAAFSGEFTIITTRRASDVAGGPIEREAAERVGESVSFGETLTWWDGRTCADWSATLTTEPAVPLNDRNLSDTQVPPHEGMEDHDRRLNQSWELSCDGEALGVLLQVDRRVLVIPTASGVTNLVLEKPLIADHIQAIQRELRHRKLLDKQPSHSWDKQSLAALAIYVEQRGAKRRFARPAITMNLLTSLAPALMANDAPSIRQRFPDYKPKKTPDTLLDYRPSLGGEVASLPASHLENLKALLKTHEEWSGRARKSPGQWEEGQVPLGAEPKEYVPSDAELMAAEVCRRTRRVVSEASADELAEALRRQNIRIRKIECVVFTFRHVDVMGSGRFFYASPPQETVIEFKTAE